MRTEQEMIELILSVAKADERIRAVSMEGSRANPAVPKDQYQDYDITYYVTDITPFYNNPTWVEERFGKPLIMQMPEAMRRPDGGGHFNYMMIYPDDNRIDLTFEPKKHTDNGEPSVVLLDKDNGNGFLPILPPPSGAVYNIKPPSPLFYYSCCNNFWWCLNNVAKGIARDELPYVMNMLNEVIRAELHCMIEWYIGTQHGFDLSVGKDGKYFKRYLQPELYAQYANTYSGSNYNEIWTAVFTMCDLFHTLTLPVAEHFGFTYRQDEENGMREYLLNQKNKKAELDFIQLDEQYRKQVDDLVAEGWAGPYVISKDVLSDTRTLPGFVAITNDEPVGYVLYNIVNGECEIIVLESLREKQGIGGTLIKLVIQAAQEAGCRYIYLTTTNDNTHAIMFYQRFGFSLREVRINAMEKARRLKPQIPMTGNDDIPIAHEFEFELDLKCGVYDKHSN